jgi:hypothetical protein
MRKENYGESNIEWWWSKTGAATGARTIDDSHPVKAKPITLTDHRLKKPFAS